MLTEQQRAQVEALLDELLDLPDAARRERLATLPNDGAVRAEVASLLRAAQSVGDFLLQPPGAALALRSDDIAVGTRLGGWRITASIGRGGMGEVFKAARVQADFDQRVAIKVLQREASAQLERFHAERRMLARMEHPGIARLLDGGSTADGRPYMVMDYVEGRSIVEYCNSTGATLEQRLRLFVQVCDAVAYAHSHLIVHRDLKPSNILVTAQGQVKLLDFGIAKFLRAQDESVTRAAYVPLTPLWAAPEQLLGKPITTATDTYALGLLLFDLLTGTHPWTSAGAPIVQALRTALQKPAPRASDKAAEKAMNDAGDVPVPPAALRGDLDAIAAKALREEPAHRYVTVAALKLDVERYLRGEPVEARSGARLYVLGRTLRRHRWAVAGLLLIVLSLAGGFGMAEYQARRAAIERDIARRDAAREEAVRYSLTRLFRAAIAERGAQPATAKNMIDNSAQRVLHQYRDQPRLAGQLVITLADLYGALEDVEGAGTLLEGFLADTRDAEPAVVAEARQKLANIELLRGHTERSAQLLAQAERFWAGAPQSYRDERLESLGMRAKLQRAQGDLDGAITSSRAAIRQRVALYGRNDRETAILYNSLAITLMSANRLEQALAAFRDTVSIYRALGLGDGLDAQIILANIGTLEYRTGRLEQAQTQLKSAFERERALAGDSAAVAAAMGYYGRVLSVRDHNAQAVGVLRESVNIATRYAGATSPVALQNKLFLGDAQLGAGNPKDAGETLTAARDAALEQYGEPHILSLRARLGLVSVMLAGHHNAEAEKELLSLLPLLRKTGRQGEGYTALALEKLADAQLATSQTNAALGSLREAVVLRERTGIKDWELARVRERLAQVQAQVGEKAETGAESGSVRDSDSP